MLLRLCFMTGRLWCTGLGHHKVPESCTQKLQFPVTGKQFMFILSLCDLVQERKPARSYSLFQKCYISSTNLWLSGKPGKGRWKGARSPLPGAVKCWTSFAAMLGARSWKQTIVNWSNTEAANCPKRRDFCISKILLQWKRVPKLCLLNREEGFLEKVKSIQTNRSSLKKKTIKALVSQLMCSLMGAIWSVSWRKEMDVSRHL